MVAYREVDPRVKEQNQMRQDMLWIPNSSKKKKEPKSQLTHIISMLIDIGKRCWTSISQLVFHMLQGQN